MKSHPNTKQIGIPAASEPPSQGEWRTEMRQWEGQPLSAHQDLAVGLWPTMPDRD